MLPLQPCKRPDTTGKLELPWAIDNKVLSPNVGKVLECQRDLVQELAALLGSAVAGQLISRFLNGELVVVGELFPSVDLPQGEDDNVLLTVNNDDTRVAVGLAGMVYETCRVAMHRGVHHFVVIDAKHVTANPLEKMTTKLNHDGRGCVHKEKKQ